MRASALSLPFSDGSISCVVALNVVHHLVEPIVFFEECARVTRPGGKIVVIEPFVSSFSSLLYKYLHHEPFTPDRSEWSLPRGGPMTTADSALSWVVLVRDGPSFERKCPDLEILRVEPHSIVTYLLTGGVSYRSLIPDWLFSLIMRFEDQLPRWPHERLASMMTVVIRRR